MVRQAVVRVAPTYNVPQSAIAVLLASEADVSFFAHRSVPSIAFVFNLRPVRPTFVEPS